jgi:butyryl-CoA dehydrogenase
VNPLVDDRGLTFLLDEVHDAAGLLALPYFADHSNETFDAYLDLCRRFGRETLFPAYRALDAEPPRFERGAVTVHPRLRAIWPRLLELGLVSASRPVEVGGAQLPLLVTTAAHLYLMAGGCAVYSYAGLTTGAAHLLEAFGAAALKETYLANLYSGRWTGTMALTEPQAGSSLADVATRATPAGDHYLLSGSKIFISGGDHDLSTNIVHMVLARIDGAPPGIRGVSLFLVPKLRPEAGALVPNDVRTTGMIHKIGWRVLPSVVLTFGEGGDCRGWLVGEPHQGVASMFQMMNEARISVGADAVATASVAYLESLAYARTRPQGRPASSRDPHRPQVPIVEHADVRRMLLRQKAIVEGALSLVLEVARWADVAHHGADAEARSRAQLVLDLLTPVAKSFPAERGFESTALAVQVLGGYGYSSEYLPEALLRDQKLNSIHEGTTGIQALDLLGRKAVAGGGAALAALGCEVAAVCVRAEKAGVPAAWVSAVRATGDGIASLVRTLGARGASGDVDGMLAHASDFLDLFSAWAVAWQWLKQAAVAKEALAAGRGPRPFYEGKLAAAQYWILTELPKADALAAVCAAGEDSFLRVSPDAF